VVDVQWHTDNVRKIEALMKAKLLLEKSCENKLDFFNDHHRREIAKRAKEMEHYVFNPYAINLN